MVGRAPSGNSGFGDFGKTNTDLTDTNYVHVTLSLDNTFLTSSRLVSLVVYNSSVEIASSKPPKYWHQSFLRGTDNLWGPCPFPFTLTESLQTLATGNSVSPILANQFEFEWSRYPRTATQYRYLAKRSYPDTYIVR